jgi:hypothetical protein
MKVIKNACFPDIKKDKLNLREKVLWVLIAVLVIMFLAGRFL